MSGSNRVTVTKKFSEDFELVSDHYGLKHISEYFPAKEAARSDLENAITCYHHLAEEIRKGEA
jgi:hypothetical protein